MNRFFFYMTLGNIIIIVSMTVSRGQAASTPTGLNWLQLQTILADPKVLTFRDACAQIGGLPINDEMKKEYADIPSKLAIFKPIDKYIEETYLQSADLESGRKKGEDMSISAVRKRLADSIIWKVSKPTLDKVTRQYLVYCDAADSTSAIAGLPPIYFDVFTDNGGAILGWRHSRVPEHFTIIIVNGHEEISGEDSVSGAWIEVLAFPKHILDVNTRWIVRYKDGPAQSSEGALAERQIIKIRNGMVFDVTIRKDEGTKDMKPVRN